MSRLKSRLKESYFARARALPHTKAAFCPSSPNRTSITPLTEALVTLNAVRDWATALATLADVFLLVAHMNARGRRDDRLWLDDVQLLRSGVVYRGDL